MFIPTFSQVHQVPTTAWRILCSVYGVCLSFCVRVASVALSSHISGLNGQHISYHWHLNHCLNHWAIKGLNGEYISYETLASTTEPSEASIDSTFHITETLTLTTEPSEASMNGTFHITDTLVLTTEPSEASMESTFHITETLALITEPSEVSMKSHFIWDTRLNQWTIRGLNGEYNSYHWDTRLNHWAIRGLNGEYNSYHWDTRLNHWAIRSLHEQYISYPWDTRLNQWDMTCCTIWRSWVQSLISVKLGILTELFGWGFPRKIQEMAIKQNFVSIYFRCGPYHFYLPPVFENGGRYCFGVRRRLRRLRRLCRLRRCFALYLGCY